MWTAVLNNRFTIKLQWYIGPPRGLRYIRSNINTHIISTSSVWAVARFESRRVHKIKGTSTITNISSICKITNISSVQVHRRNEAMQQHCKHENDSVHWYVFRGGDVWKNVPRVTRVGLVIPPPLMLRISRNFSSEEIFWGLPSSPRPKKWVFDI